MLTNLFINMCVFVFLRKQAGDCTISMVQVKCAGFLLVFFGDFILEQNGCLRFLSYAKARQFGF